MTRTARRQMTKNKYGRKVKVTAYYQQFRGGENRYNRKLGLPQK